MSENAVMELPNQLTFKGATFSQFILVIRLRCNRVLCFANRTKEIYFNKLIHLLKSLALDVKLWDKAHATLHLCIILSLLENYGYLGMQRTLVL